MDKILSILKGLKSEVSFENQTNFIDSGLLDSFDIITLVNEIEENFGIQIDALEIIPENFESVEAIRRLIDKSGGKE